MKGCLGIVSNCLPREELPNKKVLAHHTRRPSRPILATNTFKIKRLLLQGSIFWGLHLGRQSLSIFYAPAVCGKAMILFLNRLRIIAALKHSVKENHQEEKNYQRRPKIRFRAIFLRLKRLEIPLLRPPVHQMVRNWPKQHSKYIVGQKIRVSQGLGS